MPDVKPHSQLNYQQFKMQFKPNFFFFFPPPPPSEIVMIQQNDLNYTKVSDSSGTAVYNYLNLLTVLVMC
jgi:hypothetical protein